MLTALAIQLLYITVAFECETLSSPNDGVHTRELSFSRSYGMPLDVQYSHLCISNRSIFNIHKNKCKICRCY